MVSGLFQGTDLTMLQKLTSIHANNKAFLHPKNIHDARFGIAHFAGEVYYQAEGEYCSAYTVPRAGVSTGETRQTRLRGGGRSSLTNSVWQLSLARAGGPGQPFPFPFYFSFLAVTLLSKLQGYLRKVQETWNVNT